MSASPKPRLWVSGDWNGLFGFGTNLLVNLLTLTALLRYVLRMPDELIFGRILPATGLMLFLSTVYYAWLAYRLARRTGRSDVCALPSGISVGHMFIVVLVIMLPILRKTGDPVKAWEAGLTWVFIQSIVLIFGGVIAPVVRRVTPRAALLGTLAGIAITFIAMGPALQMFMTPAIGFLCFAIVMASWFGGVRYFGGIPAGMVAIAAGSLIAWGSNLLGFSIGGLSISRVAGSLTNFGFHFPIPAVGHVFSGFQYAGTLLVTAIPFGIYDLVEAIDNVESAAVAGDSFPSFRVLAADGVVSMVGCLMGNPFINAVYVGHSGWKAMGGRIGYSAGSGLSMLVLCWLGLIPIVLTVLPGVAVLPILLYIGMLMGSQAFQETPRSHAPAVVLAIIPSIASWVFGQINGALSAAGSYGVGDELAEKLANQGVLYRGLETLSQGSVLTGLVFSAVAALIIDRKLGRAAIFAGVGAVLTFFGFMHGQHLGINQNPQIAVSYLMVAAFLAGCSVWAKSTPSPTDTRASEI
jgi:AGZA family xanthine/uracil permease-like MFS transporter